jgi:hypothetical protein
MANSQRERLLKQQLQIKEKITRLDAREGERNRKKETRRKVLAGAAILAKVERGDWSKEGFRKMMDAFLSRPSDRSLFDLPILDGPTDQSDEPSLENGHNDQTEPRQINEEHPQRSVI